jgi:eukaryotic-like serine/threonine-protein kinase
MGTVYAGVELATGRRVAVKVLLSSDDPQQLARFNREARLMARLSHPNLVPLLGFEHHDGLHFLVMKFVVGERLSDRLRARGRHLLREALPLLRQSSSALQYLHARGVVHRDVKPENILVGDDGHVTLLDYGLARPDGSLLTAHGLAVGTPQYMAPEQAEGRAVDHRADLYSLAQVAYYLLTGQPVFPGSGGLDAIRRHLIEVPQLASQRSRAVSEAAALVLARALEKSPAARQASVAEFYQALEEALAADSTLTGAPRADHSASSATTQYVLDPRSGAAAPTVVISTPPPRDEEGTVLASLPSLPSLPPLAALPRGGGGLSPATWALVVAAVAALGLALWQLARSG